MSRVHPILISLISLAGLWSHLVGYKSSSSSTVAIAGSMAMALVVATLTGFIARMGLRVSI